MFFKKKRLTKNKDFDNVFKNGFSSFDNVLGVKAVKNNFSFFRFGIIVSIKVSKKAVERNKIKRQIRAIIQNITKEKEKGYDVVIITQPAILNKKYFEIENSILKHFKKLKLI